uniref:Glutathione S-transferase n=1 Tax=Cyberlindnera americana TaxID=36016 RepID=A0A5P8N8V9_9ASCO|nr:glutathione S-transferase [Cyberlindnera americana]
MTKRANTSKDLSIKKSRHSIIVHDGDPSNSANEAPFLKIFSSQTPNGQKVLILLELLGIDYIYRPLDIKNESKKEWYLQLNPAGKIPLIQDVDNEGESFTLSESGAILLYLSEKYDKDNKFSYPKSSNYHWKEIEFILFHASGLNPDQKNYNLVKANDSKNEDGLKIAKDSLLKSYQFFENTLKSNGNTGYLIGDHLSLADIIAFPHANSLDSSIDTSNWPLFQKWLANISSIPEVKTALSK